MVCAHWQEEENGQPMGKRSEAVLTVTFGPSSTPTLPRALSYAREHADSISQVEQGVWRATFRLEKDEDRYGRAAQFLWMVSGWKSTYLEVDGSPENQFIARVMVDCARAWLRTAGACRASFSGPLPSKCLPCPLYDPEWALESSSTYTTPPMSPHLWGVIEVDLPDHPPEDWEDPRS
jgi:hypothetical protein